MSQIQRSSENNVTEKIETVDLYNNVSTCICWNCNSQKMDDL